jgi:hypothetical protein
MSASTCQQMTSQSMSDESAVAAMMRGFSDFVVLKSFFHSM